MDIEFAYFTEKPKFLYKKVDKKDVPQTTWDDLIKQYHKYHDLVLLEAKKDTLAYRKKMDAFDKKTCFCGSPLRYIRSYDFWGCSNYKDKTLDHVTFSGHSPVILSDYIRIPSTWLVDILRASGHSDAVNVKLFYEYLIGNGYEDLRIKYGRNTSENSFNGLIKAKQRSKVQEDAAEKYLKTLYTKVVPQTCIKYKIKDKKETFCIPDFICSNISYIVVVDAKLDRTNDDKMELYLALVKFIMDQKGDTRTLEGAHIMYEQDIHEYLKSKYEIIEIPTTL